MEQEVKKPFKTVTTEYFEEIDYNMTGAARRKSRKIRVVTTSKQWIGSDKDPVTSTNFEYL